MRKKAQITSQSCHWWVTIRKNQHLKLTDLKLWCDTLSQGEMYGFIEHDGDISPDTGEKEGCHYHIVINTPKRLRKGQLLNDIVDTFGFDNPFGIEVDIYSSFEGCLQYLTHQNEPLKTPHKKSEIIHNIDSNTFDSIMDTPLATQLTAGSLIALIEKSKTPMELAKELGLGTFDHYYRTIRVFWKRIKQEDL